jgi:hypothetical protein
VGSKTGGKRNDAARDKYIEWVRIPKTEKMEMRKTEPTYPITKDEFGKKWGVNRATLWRWEQEPDFKRDVADQGLGLISADELSAILCMLKKDALDENLKFRDRVLAQEKLLLWSGIIGQFAMPTQKPDDDEDEDFFSKMSEADLEKYLNENNWGGDEED